MTLKHLGAWTAAGDQPDYVCLNRIGEDISLVARQAVGGAVTRTAAVTIPRQAFGQLVMSFLRDVMAEQLGMDPGEGRVQVVLVAPGYKVAVVAEDTPLHAAP